MAVVKNMMVRAGADFSAITKQASKASSSMRGMQSSVSRSCNAMSKAASGLKKAFAAVGAVVSIAAIVNAAKDAAAAYDEVVENEVRLATVMRNTMAASNDEIQSILDLADAQEQLGIVDADATVAGAQELATYLETSDALQQLIPVMNDMAAQQYGFNVTSEQTASIATMLGKVMEGQTGALSRYGYYFSEAEEHILKFGNEAQRAAMLAQVVQRSVGGMNQALAQTPTGRMKQLSNTLANIKQQFGQAVRTIGTVFLPVLQKVAQVLAAVATLANKVAQTIANVFGGKAAGKEWKFTPTTAGIEDTADAYDDTTTAVDNLSGSTSHLANSTKQAAKAAKDAKQAYQQMGFDTLNILKENEEEEEEEDTYDPTDTYSPSNIGNTGGGGGGSDASNMIQEIETGTEEASEGIGWLENLLEKVKAIWKDFTGALDFTNLKEAFGKLKEAAKPLIDDIGKGLQWLYENVLKPLASWTISELAPRLVETLAAAFKFLHGVIVALQPLLEAIWPILKWLAQLAGFAITKALDELNHALSVLGDWMAGNLSPMQEFLVVLQLLAALSLGNLIGELITLANAAGTAAAAAATLGGAVGAGGASAGIGLAMAGGGGLVAALGAGAGAASAFSLGITGTMVPALGAGTAAAGGAAAGAAGLLGPIAAVIAIVAALGIAIYEVVKHWDEIKEVAGRAWESIKQTWNSAGAWFRTNVSEPIIEGGKQTWKEAKDAAGKAWDGIKQAWSGAGTWFRTTVSEPLIESSKQTWETAKETGKEAAKALAESVKTTWSDIRDRFRQARTELSGDFENIKQLGSNAWNAIRSSAQSAGEGMRSAFNSAAATIKTSFSGIQSLFANTFSSVASLANNAISGIINSFQNLLASATNVANNIRNTFSSLMNVVSNTANSVRNAVSNLSLSNVVNSVRSKVSSLSISIPHLASGAVIPPNREFTAVLGDQSSGMNIETPERLLREIVREESGNSAMMMILGDILEAIRAGKEITVDGYRLGRTMQRYQTMAARSNG